MKTNKISELLKLKLTLVFMLISFVLSGCATVKPTATVVDDETGMPIEGAVAIAIWRSDTEDCTLVQGLEGGCWGFKKAEEAVSDKNGNINIETFWDYHFSSSDYDPRLTVYKFGYVCWDQQKIFAPDWKWTARKDFNKKHRIVRMKKWPLGMSFHEHLSFIGNCLGNDYSGSITPLFMKEFESEGPYFSNEIK
jgi:hypothetical protein